MTIIHTHITMCNWNIESKLVKEATNLRSVLFFGFWCQGVFFGYKIETENNLTSFLLRHQTFSLTQNLT